MFQKIIKYGFLNFIRNTMVSFSAVLVMTITLSVVFTMFLFQTILNFSLDQIKEKVDVIIYFVPGARESEILSLKESLEKIPEVSEITYTSADEALVSFREKHSKDYITIQALDEIKSNPLGGHLNIKAQEVSQYESIANFLSSDQFLSSGTNNIVDKINYFQNKDVIDRLNSILNGAQRLGIIITFLLIIVSIIVTFNTIRLTIFIAKEEIGIMRLVGASRARVQSPFLVEGAIYGTLASILTMLLFWPATYWMGEKMTTFLGIDLFEYFKENMWQIFIILLIFGITLGMISSFFAIRKYLNK